MDKRYQVFVSSTFVDLKEERQAVLKAILELNHMPAGMELFPASDETAWQLIKDVIDGSDYYVLILGGRYGSQDEAGLGYTEKEYGYAVLTKKPVIALLHKNPNSLPRDKTETDESIWKKLEDFRKRIEKKHTCTYWVSSDELKSNVILGLTSIIKRLPAVGWIRADKVPSKATLEDVLALKNRVSELEQEAEKNKIEPPSGSEEFEQGDDEYQLNYSFSKRISHNYDFKYFEGTIGISWNHIFAAVAPCMINESSENELFRAFRTCFENHAINYLQEQEDFQNQLLDHFSFADTDIETCIIQFRALGLICDSKKPRSVKDNSCYWTLTPYGDYLMTRLRAIRKSNNEGDLETS